MTKSLNLYKLSTKKGVKAEIFINKLLKFSPPKFYQFNKNHEISTNFHSRNYLTPTQIISSIEIHLSHNIQEIKVFCHIQSQDRKFQKEKSLRKSIDFHLYSHIQPIHEIKETRFILHRQNRTHSSTFFNIQEFTYKL